MQQCIELTDTNKSRALSQNSIVLVNRDQRYVELKKRRFKEVFWKIYMQL